VLQKAVPNRWFTRLPGLLLTTFHIVVLHGPAHLSRKAEKQMA